MDFTIAVLIMVVVGFLLFGAGIIVGQKIELRKRDAKTNNDLGSL